MDRRSFLRRSTAQAGALISASAAFSLTACGGGDAGTPVQPTPPAPPLPPVFPGTSTPLPQTPAATGAFKFPQSVASGDPKPDGIVLWSRVVPGSAGDVASVADGNFSVKLRISSDAGNAAAIGSTTALSGTLAAEADVPVFAYYDHTLRHRITGLQPSTVYYYQFTAGDNRSKVGRFKTAPAATADNSNLKFAFVSCQDWSVNHWAGMTALANEPNLDFIVHLGDYIYETVGEAFQTGAVEATHDALVLPNGTAKPGNASAKYATTTADYRYLYKKYRTDARLQNLHERYAFVAVWDDHEFSDDCWGDRSTYDNGTFDAATGTANNTQQTARRLSASQAWFEYMPADIVYTQDPAQGFANIRIYRDLKFGQLMHLVMTDQRLYRADHIIPEAAPLPGTTTPVGSIGSRYMVPEATLTTVEGQKLAAGAALPDPLALVSVLGGTQRQWWVQTLASSTSLWKIWGNEVSLLKMAVDASKLPGVTAPFNTKFILNADQWDGFNKERQFLMGQLLTRGIKNVVAVTGDIHAFYAGQVMADYNATTPVPAMVDLVTAGLSSNSNFSYFLEAASSPAFSKIKPLVATSEAEAEGIAIQMLSAAIALASGVTNLSNTAAIQAAVGAAIQAGMVPAAAFAPTPGLSTATVNTFDETQSGAMGTVVSGVILSMVGRSTAATTLYGLIAQKIATAMGIPAAAVPASAVRPFLNPFANAQGQPPANNNPWIKHVDSDAQGYAVVSLSKTELVCQFKKLNRLSGGAAPGTPVASTVTATVPVNSATVTIS
ncbi:alkaline phosphatase D [Inhella inkyongensis]|uniref:Alkaline phosphatase D n=1 Tax=Inhella inkyongensis TaxID=392593 RepID=A0A840S083_9BURK|nr:alkaline phosphatase D family protein [Inhella inkyongensis]MBB5202912.1 alkaline phosphatase D [Inhella inkyongensis]